MGDKMKVRFLVNKATSKILYMETGKDFVDVLFGFLQLPLATIFSVFAEAAPMQLGSISNVYDSLRKLSDSSFVVSKESLLDPPCPLEFSRDNPKLLLPASTRDVDGPPNVIYSCSNNTSHDSVSWVSGKQCPECYRNNGNLSRAMNVLNFADQGSDAAAPPSSASSLHSQGYVKEYFSFIVTDDLCILPASTIESIVLLNKLHVEKMSDLDSQEACVTAPEALELLKVSFTSRSALNLVFGKSHESV